ncbi:MAG: hypothetical protein HC882_01365 [Acidobacteria bacterium]|nr:hypothetical protein [Acidobacteriota bacterium]
MPKITLYRCKFDTAPIAVPEWNAWRDLARLIGEPKPFLDKERDVPMFSGTELVPGATLRKGQSQSDFRGVHVAVFDLDKHPHEKGPDGKSRPLLEDEVATLVSGLRVDFLLTSSWSHTGNGSFRGRLILPLSRVVLPSEWPRLWPVINRIYAGGLSDPACKDIARRYWVPSYPEGTGIRPVYVVEDRFGAAIDVDACLLDAVPMDARGPALGGVGPLGTPTREQLQQLSTTWSKSTRASTAKLGGVLRAIVKGDPYAHEEGERDNLLFQLCGDLVTRWPNLNPEATAVLFAPSLYMMEALAPGAPTVEKAADILKRRQQRGLQERTELIRQAIGQDDPYTAEDLDGFAAKQGLSLEELRRHWILQKDRSFYVLVAGRYKGPYTEKEIKAVVRRDLSPAVHLELDFVTEKGVRAKNLDELMRDYGTVIDGVEADMGAQFAHYDVERRVLVEAPCPIRHLEPEYNPYIDQWIRFLGGIRYGILEQWLACVTRLDEPLAALFLTGVKGAGKSMLAEGVSQIWGPRPSQIQEVIGGNFNDQAAKNPVVFVDEMGPLQSQAGFRTHHLRWLVQARVRPLHRKYHAPATLLGARGSSSRPTTRRVGSRRTRTSRGTTSAPSPSASSTCPWTTRRRST